jgi:hypothetical protein
LFSKSPSNEPKQSKGNLSGAQSGGNPIGVI